MTKRVMQAASAAVLAMGVPAFAVPVTWDGNGDPNAGGNWSLGTNWDSDTAPLAGDDVNLDSVSAGTRVVTQDSATPITINSLTLTQSGLGGVNQLSLSGDLAIARSASPVSMVLTGGATAANAVVDLNGFDILLLNSNTGTSNFTVSLAGTVNLNAAGSGLYTNHGIASHTTINVSGVVNVTADGRLGRTQTSTTVNNSGNMNLSITSTGLLSITSGTFSFDSIGRRGQDRTLAIHNNGVLHLAAGATLVGEWGGVPTTSSNKADVLINNNATGSLLHGGSIQLRPHKDAASANSPVITLTNNGTWTISGTAASIKRLDTAETPSYVAVTTFNIGGSGLLRGSGASDALEYNEETNTGARLTVSHAGTIAPGAGTNQAGLSSVGMLALRDIDLTFGATGKLNLDVGGTAAGQYDVLALQTGATDPAGAGTLDLSAAGDTLAVTLVNGFAPGGDFAIPIIGYGAITLGGEVGFDILSINGLTDNAPTYNDGVGVYSISYGGSSASLMYSVPEPGTAGLIATAGLALLRRRRRSG